MSIDFGPSFTVAQNSLKFFRILWKFLDGSTEWDQGYYLLAHSIRSRFGAKNHQSSGWEQNALGDCAKLRICQMTAQIGAVSFPRAVVLTVIFLIMAHGRYS